MTEYYNQLQQAAWEANVSISKLCREANVNRSTVARWKNDQTAPQTRTLNKLLTAAEELKKQNRFRTAHR